MDDQLRYLQRLVAAGDQEAKAKLHILQDRACLSYPVYIVTQTEWEYNDNWYDPHGDAVVKAYRTKEEAEKAVLELTRHFLIKTDLTSHFGSYQLAELQSIEFFQELGFILELDDTEQRMYSCRASSDFSLEQTAKFMKKFPVKFARVVETLLQ